MEGPSLDIPTLIALFVNDVCGGPPGGTGGTPSPRARFMNLRGLAFFAGALRAAFFAGDFFAEVFRRALLFFAELFLRAAGRLAAFFFGRDFFAAFFFPAGARFAAFFFFAGAFLRAAFFADFRPFFAAIGRLRI